MPTEGAEPLPELRVTVAVPSPSHVVVCPLTTAGSATSPHERLSAHSGAMAFICGGRKEATSNTTTRMAAR